MEVMDRLCAMRPEGAEFVLVNLVDFDSLYGHRRDPAGYARCLIEFDGWLGGFLERWDVRDALWITADHGNDPYHAGTDHTREQVPLLGYGSAVAGDGDFADLAKRVEAYFLGV
jgi:phosphopentomutase